MRYLAGSLFERRAMAGGTDFTAVCSPSFFSRAFSPFSSLAAEAAVGRPAISIIVNSPPRRVMLASSILAPRSKRTFVTPATIPGRSLPKAVRRKYFFIGHVGGRRLAPLTLGFEFRVPIHRINE